MNRYLLLPLLILCLCFAIQPAKAQLQDERRNFSIGVNGGVNLSSVSFQPRIREGKLIGPSAGITARYISEKYFSMICGIQAEINYSQYGWKEVYDDETGDSYKHAMNYIEIPVLAHLAFGKDQGNGLRFIVNLGPQFGYLLGEKETFNWSSERTGEQYGKMADRKLEYGIVGGGGMEIRTGIGHFLIEARYYYGLSDFYNNSKKDYFERSGHSYIGGRITYLFDLKK
jgi:hypothetical protein